MRYAPSSFPRLPSLALRLFFACAIAVTAAVVSCANGAVNIPSPDSGPCAHTCSGATPVCNATTGMCVGCASNSDCGDGGVCIPDGGTCQSRCTMDSQCKDPANPRCETMSGHCVPCLPMNDNCPKGDACIETMGVYACAKGCDTVADCNAGDAGAHDAGKDGGGVGGISVSCCNHICVDLGSNPANCHTCGNMCPGVQACCSAACTDLASNPNDCNGCGKACSHNNMATVTCGGGVCNGTCAPGFADCNNDKLSDGCEATVSNDPINCGGCNVICSSNNVAIVSCDNGVCDGACASGFADCKMMEQSMGCETNINADPMNCGGCMLVCSNNHVPVPACAGGICDGACAAGWSDCNMNKLTDGCEANTATDILNCGGCGLGCSPNNIVTVTCANSVCNGMCTPGFTDCNMNKQTDGCEANLQTDPVDCGTCGTVCSNNHMATVTCGAGICNGTCAPGWSDCNMNKQTDGCEANTGTDPNNCGMCGHVCGDAGNACAASACIHNYTSGPSPQAFVDACTIAGHMTYLPLIDDGATALLAMPFPFAFYNAPVTTYWLSSNGAFGFGGTPSSTLFFVCLPSASDPSPVLLPFACDMVQGPNGICVATTGAAPNRQLVATWNDAHLFSDGTAHLTFTAFLNETTNTIDVVYQTMTGASPNAQGAIAVVGVQATGAALGDQFSCDMPNEPSGTAIRFTP